MPVLDKENLLEVERYDRFVKGSPYSIVTQDLSWAKVKNHWKNEQVYVERKGEIVAAMSLLIRPVGKYSLIYAPRGPVCNIKDIDLVMELLDCVNIIAKQYKAFAFRFDPEVERTKELEESFIKKGFIVRNDNFSKEDLIQPRFNMILDIKEKTEEALLKEFSPKTRYNLRVAAKNGISVRYSTSKEDLKLFYDLFTITCKRDGFLGRSFDYFIKIMDAFDDNKLRIYLAEYKGQVLSGAIAINYGRKMWYLYGASSNEKRNFMPNYAMQMEMIRWGLEEKCEIYDFGGVYVISKENGLYKFKEGFCRQKGVTEFIGEIERVYNKPIHWVFSHLVPSLIRMKKRIKQ